jgi:SAM-dependent methyltransferase
VGRAARLGRAAVIKERTLPRAGLREAAAFVVNSGRAGRQTGRQAELSARRIYHQTVAERRDEAKANFITCRICGSPFAPEIQEIYLERQQFSTAQRYCMECDSFFHTSGYVETDQQLAADLGWLLAHPASHEHLVRAIRQHFPRARTCYEVGCGTGSLLAALQEAGYMVSGVEPNPLAVRHALETYGITVTEGRFEGPVRADVILAIDVLEHVPTPRWFFETMSRSVGPEGGIAVRVPTVDRHQWRFLLNAAEPRPFSIEDPFSDASVHINNFSTKGLLTLAASFDWTKLEVVDGVVIFGRTSEDTASVASSVRSRRPLHSVLSGLRRLQVRQP